MYVPMELCTVLPGQMLRRKFSAEQTRAMTTKACRVPEDSVGLIINEGAGIMGIKTQVHPNLVRLFSLIESTMLTLLKECFWTFC